MYMLKGIIIASAFLSILVSGIVNLAVSHHFSWFYIVAASVLYAVGITCIILFKDKNKIRDALITASVFILPLLGIIEAVTNNFYLHQPIFWLKSIAMPITLCWLVIIWITFYMIKYTNIKNLYCISGGFVLSMAGSAITNLVVGVEYPKGISGLKWIGIICCGVLALIFYVVGVMQSKDKI